MLTTATSLGSARNQSIGAKKARLIMIFAPKGGVGKTTLATNLAVAAAASGQKVAGLDFDPQRHFTLWSVDRNLREDVKSLPDVQVAGGDLRAWREEVRLLRHKDFIIIDTPPRAESDVGILLREVGKAADLILMPVEVYGGSIRFVVQFMAWWKMKPDHAVFVLNKTISGRTILRDARELLEACGTLWDGNIPQRDDLARQLDLGLAALDAPDFQGRESFAALWRFCEQKTRVPVP